MKNRSKKLSFGIVLTMLLAALSSIDAYAANGSESGGSVALFIIIPIIIVVVVIVLIAVSKNLNRNAANRMFSGQQPPQGYGDQPGNNAQPFGGTPSPYGSSDTYYGDPARQNGPQNVGQGNYQGYVPGVFSAQSNNSRRSNSQQNNGNDPIALKCPNCGAPLGESDDITTCPYCRSVLTNANLRAGRRPSGPVDFSAQDSVFNGFGDDAVHTGYGEESYHNAYGNGYGLGFDDNDFD